MNAPPLFPLPLLHNDERSSGAVLALNETCRNCKDTPCASGPIESIAICPYGYNFYRPNKELTIIGLLLTDWTLTSPARTKRQRRTAPSDQWVTTAHLTAAVSAYRDWQAERANRLRDTKERAIAAYVATEQDKQDFLKQFQEQIVRGLSFVHDYRQINAQIAQNINVLLSAKYGGTPEQQLEKATHAERAIYFAAKFLEEKLNVARFLLRPEWLHLPNECTRFRVHGLVLKYQRIYQYWFTNKNVRITMAGESRREIVANPTAVGVIPHTLIDNALKYSTRGEEVEIDIEDVDAGVQLAVSSYGPKIETDELDKIFHAFYRGRHAIEAEEDGSGYGLYVAQLIAREHLGTKLTVRQDPLEPGRRTYWTTFEILLPNKAKVAL